MQASPGACTYIPSGVAVLFTVTLLPEETGKFPVVIMCHTNQKGLFSAQTTGKIARNTVYLQDSVLCLPTEP